MIFNLMGWILRIDFFIFCNIEPFSAKVMLLIGFFDIIRINAKNIMSLWVCSIDEFIYKFDDILKLLFTESKDCLHFYIE